MTTMYGRKEALAELIKKLDEPYSFTPIYGPEGMGKSTLLRIFYESLLKKNDLVVGYTHFRYREEPFSQLVASLLTSLHRRCYEKGEPDRFREILANLKTALGRLGSDRVIMALFGATVASLLEAGLKEIVRLLQPLAYGEQIFDAGFSLSAELSPDRMVSLVRILTQVMEDYKIVLIIDEIDDDTHWILENWTMDRLHIYLAQDAEWRIGGGMKLAPLSRSEVEEYIREAAPAFLYRYNKTSLAQLTEGIPFIIHELIKKNISAPTDMERISSRLTKKDYSPIKERLAGYDQQRQGILLQMAVLKYPLPLDKLARLLNYNEDKCLRFLQGFEDDLLLNRIYLEREDLFCFSSRGKQKAVLGFGEEGPGLISFHRQAADYFTQAISLPTLEEPSSFWTNLAAVLHHCQAAGEKEAAEFYGLALNKAHPWKDLSRHPYFASLESPLKIIIHYHLIKSGEEDISVLPKIIRDKEASEGLKVEYAKVLFCLAGQAGRERKIDRLREIVNLINDLFTENPQSRQISIIYAHTLTNACFDLGKEKEFKDLHTVINRLAHLAETNQDSEVIQILYAKSLAHTSQQLGGVKRMIHSVKDLAEDNPIAAYYYLNSLINLSFDLGRRNKVEDIQEIIQEIETLINKNPSFLEAKIAMAKVIANASLSLGRTGRFKELEYNLTLLASIYGTNKERREIAAIYGQTLTNAASDLGEAGEFNALQGVFDKIEALFQENPRINLIYGQALANACLDCGRQDQRKAMERYLSSLETLTQIFDPSYDKLKTIYAKALGWTVMISNKPENLYQMEDRLKCLNKLARKDKSSPEILTICRRIMFNLINYFGGLKQWEYLKMELTELEHLQEPYQEGEEIYLEALLNTVFFFGEAQRLDDMEEYLHVLQILAKREERAEDIYLKALVNACLYWGKNGRFSEMDAGLARLAEMAEKGRREAVRAYSSGLLNTSETLGKSGRFKELKKIREKIDILINKYPEEDWLKTIGAKILVNAYNDLQHEQKVIELNAVINEMEEMSRQYEEARIFLRELNFPL
ncbi:MAG: AAA family ATPase [bacterium]